MSDSLPSSDLTWGDLDESILVVVVAPTGEARVWCEDATDPAAHAALLRGVADQLDPRT